MTHFVASILIVCYQSKGYISDCLLSVLKFENTGEYETLLLDCSNDGTVDLVRDQFPWVKIVDNTENLGFSKGNNLLASVASGRFLVLLNADTVLLDNAISKLIQVAKSDSKVGAVGGRARLPNGKRDPGSRQSIPTLLTLGISALGGAKWLNGALPEDAKQPGSVQTLSGAFMLVPTSRWQEMGGLDASFFAYSEELDLCFRLRKAGYKILMEPSAEIVHLGGGGVPRPERSVLKTKSMMHFMRKHHSPLYAMVAVGLLLLHAIIRVVGSLILFPFFGWNRAKQLRAAFLPILIKPNQWKNG